MDLMHLKDMWDFSFHWTSHFKNDIQEAAGMWLLTVLCLCTVYYRHLNKRFFHCFIVALEWCMRNHCCYKIHYILLTSLCKNTLQNKKGYFLSLPMPAGSIHNLKSLQSNLMKIGMKFPASKQLKQETGRLQAALQDPSGPYTHNTSVP